MKTTILKTGLPLLVFTLAIATAFATQNRTSINEEALVLGFTYNNDSSDCINAPKDCCLAGTIVCTYNDKNVYRFKNDTMCLVNLFECP
ncbi:hypothetical protein ED312_06535 [Sinomicrobium pectinilyticum]|uniref:DUF3551 domain-containing protein n=1 Tax=Sinomicrobium pectinilyticum TaxID=1084421 RepID=A0A3N0ER36_SINP1|nr:DUF6520 family protein [Sinomicrobium pectinilyticum]RNL90323.1 hypothetical protein ED312_06535 [Sinomicrobium pectinilyticum]